MNPEVTDYYNAIAPDYDLSRFGNTYGQFIQEQEHSILQLLLEDQSLDKIIDLGCGTGRFLNFAQFGVDISEQMLEIAQSKFPTKSLFHENATHTHFPNQNFSCAFSFHVFMHLNPIIVQNFIDEAYRILKPGGKFIFDIPSKKRRRLVNYKTDGWHGANDFTIQEIKGMVNGKWEISFSRGILFLPIHRFPKTVRKAFVKLDTFLCRSFLKEYSSYLVFELKKI